MSIRKLVILFCVGSIAWGLLLRIATAGNDCCAPSNPSADYAAVYATLDWRKTSIQESPFQLSNSSSSGVTTPLSPGGYWSLLGSAGGCSVSLKIAAVAGEGQEEPPGADNSKTVTAEGSATIYYQYVDPNGNPPPGGNPSPTYPQPGANFIVKWGTSGHVHLEGLVKIDSGTAGSATANATGHASVSGSAPYITNPSYGTNPQVTAELSCGATTSTTASSTNTVSGNVTGTLSIGPTPVSVTPSAGGTVTQSTAGTVNQVFVNDASWKLTIQGTGFIPCNVWNISITTTSSVTVFGKATATGTADSVAHGWVQDASADAKMNVDSAQFFKCIKCK